MKHKLLTFVMAFFIGLTSFAALAQETPKPTAPVAEQGFQVPDGDVAQILLKLATDWKTLGTLGALVLILLLSVQAVKKFLPDTNKYKRLIVLSLSVIYSILSGLVIPGSNAATVIVTVFITSGGAVALYEALKGAGIIKSA